MKDKLLIKRTFELAKNGLGSTTPNPMVGALIEKKGEILAEGWHYKSGEAHAEVVAISQLSKEQLLGSTLYVSLEPCSHKGKTPPCVDLIIEKKISKVVIAIKDYHEKVNGQGIKKLKDAGIEVVLMKDSLKKEAYELNKRFFTFQNKKRPFIIMKWAQSADGFIDKKREEGEEKRPFWISNIYSRSLCDLWRSQEDAILVGKNTVLIDNPKLSLRSIEGKAPIRIIIDPNLSIDSSYHIYDDSFQKSLFFTLRAPLNPYQIKINPEPSFLKNLLYELYKREIQSVLIEGGAKTIEKFAQENLWDEAYIFVAPIFLHEGLRAPLLKGKQISQENIDDDLLIKMIPFGKIYDLE